MLHNLHKLAAEVGKRTEAQARAALDQRWFRLRLTEDERGGWRFDVITGPGMNRPSYICVGGSGFATYGEALDAGTKRMELARRGEEVNRQPFSVIGGTP